MSSERSIITLNARDIPITAVTVYTDRAEVLRDFKVKLKPGLNEIQLENIAESIQQDTLRVDGQGDAIIHEVKFETKLVNVDVEDTPKIKDLKTELTKLEDEVQKEQNLQKIYHSQIKTLNNLAAEVSVSKAMSYPVLTFDEKFFTSLKNFFEFHVETSTDIESKEGVSKERVTSLNAEIDRVKKEISIHQNVPESK